MIKQNELTLSIFIGLLMSILFLIKDNILIPIVLLFMIFFIIYILNQKKIKYENFIVLLLASSAFTHSIGNGAINISISDIYLVISLLILVIIKNEKITIPKGYLFLVMIYLSLCLLTFIKNDEIKRTLIRIIQYSEYMLFAVLVFCNINSVRILKKCYIYI